MDNRFEELNRNVSNLLDINRSNQMLILVLAIVVIVYTIFVVPMLTYQNLSWLDSNLAKGILIALIAMTIFYNPAVAVLLVIAYIVTVIGLNRKKREMLNPLPTPVPVDDGGNAGSVNNGGVIPDDQTMDSNMSRPRGVDEVDSNEFINDNMADNCDVCNDNVNSGESNGNIDAFDPDDNYTSL